MSTDTETKRQNVPIRGDLHKRASDIAKSRGGIKLQAIGDWAFEMWLKANEGQPTKKAGRK